MPTNRALRYRSGRLLALALLTLGTMGVCQTPDAARAVRTDAHGELLLRTGTAFFVSHDGYMLTSAHVVNGCQHIQVWPADARGLTATLIATDERLDLALLATHHPAEFASFPQRVRPSPRDGSTVYTIGFGLTPSTAAVPVLTEGLIGGTAQAGGHPVLVIHARLHEGNSGGPVIDDSGALQGMIIGRYITRPELSVALRASELSAFLEWHGVRNNARPADGGGNASPERQLQRIASVVQCN
jgi:S1-C subfamily serine protease